MLSSAMPKMRREVSLKSEPYNAISESRLVLRKLSFILSPKEILMSVSFSFLFIFLKPSVHYNTWFCNVKDVETFRRCINMPFSEDV